VGKEKGFNLAVTSLGQANGKLQMMDVGQGDGAVLISPKGAVVLFDTGVRNNCDKPISYLQQLGVTHVDYIFVSHYHADHIGCVPQVTQEFPRPARRV
jgi:competence protein ComEC